VPLPRLCPGRQSVISFCYEAQVFRVSQYHFAHQQRPIFGALGTRRQDFESKFSKNFHGWYSGPNSREGYPFRTHRQYNFLLCAGLKPPVPGPKPSCPCAQVRTTSWRRHCLEQDRHGPFTSTCPLFPQLFLFAPLLSFSPFPSFRSRIPLIPFPSPPSPFYYTGPRVFLPRKLFKPRWLQVKIGAFLGQNMTLFWLQTVWRLAYCKTLVLATVSCDVCRQLRSKNILTAGISRLLEHNDIGLTTKFPTAVSKFSRSKFLMVSIPVGLSFNVDSTSARNPRWRSPKWKATSLGSCRYLLSCHVMSCHAMAVILNLIETGIAPFDSQSQKTLNRTWSESDYPLRRYGHSKFENSTWQGVHLRPQFWGKVRL